MVWGSRLVCGVFGVGRVFKVVYDGVCMVPTAIVVNNRKSNYVEKKGEFAVFF